MCCKHNNTASYYRADLFTQPCLYLDPDLWETLGDSVYNTAVYWSIIMVVMSGEAGHAYDTQFLWLHHEGFVEEHLMANKQKENGLFVFSGWSLGQGYR